MLLHNIEFYSCHSGKGCRQYTCEVMLRIVLDACSACKTAAASMLASKS